MFGLNLWARPFLHAAPSSAQTGALDPTVASSYLPNPLASPALMVLASSAAAEGSRDGGPLPHVLSGSRQGDKEAASGMLHPFAAGAFPFIRPGHPHLAGLHSPLWRPQLDPATLGLLSGRGAGAFHPLGKEDGYPSAFLPAAKRAKLTDERPMSPGDGPESGREDSRTPHSLDRRPSSAASRHGSQSDVGSEHGDRYTPDSSVKDLSKWVSADGQGICCPICQAVLQPGEVQSHLAKELSELNIMLNEKLNGDNSSMKKSDNAVNDLSSTRDVSSKSRYETFLRIKGNREARLAKLRGRRRRYNEMAQQMLHNSSATSTNSLNLLDSSTEKETCDEEHIDVISCEDSKDPTPSSLAQSPNASKSEAKRDSITCSECLEPYTNCCPITSMQCWHVHCEKCWFKAMETKKLCPQCGAVTSPSDLRRIFI